MDLPQPPKFRKLLGPSFVLLGLGLGSGEIVLWPYLSANFGLGIIWGAVIGITLQFFMNMEIERYALAVGESVFVGFWRKFKYLPYWFIISTFFAWSWPGIIGSSAKIFANIFGFSNFAPIAIILLLVIGLILTLGPVIYKTVEGLQKILISISVPAIFLLAIFLAKSTDWQALVKGAVGMGSGYLFLPSGISIATFLGALAFSGAGGNLNLAQSFYVKEKGYGMGKFSGKMTSVLTGRQEEIKLLGKHFSITGENLKKFNRWWRLINTEHAVVFWLTGLITMLLLSLLAYSTTYSKSTLSGIGFLFFESEAIGSLTYPIVGILFLVVCAVMLFATQLTVMDATSRIMAENLVLTSKNHDSKVLPKAYYIFLWLQIIFGLSVFLFSAQEPFFLLILQSALNAFCMFVHIGLTLWLNLSLLDKKIQPATWRIVIMVAAFLFFGFFTAKTILG